MRLERSCSLLSWGLTTVLATSSFITLVASIPSDEMAVHFRWMMPSVSHAERVGMLQGMRQGMPPEVFASQLDMARPLLDARAWHKLKTAFQRDMAASQEMQA